MAENDDLMQIIAGCKAGKSDSFAALVDKFSSRCYGYFYRMTGNRDLSDDLLSELFVKLVVKIGSYSGGSFESWLFTVAANVFRDYLRTKHRQTKLLEIKKKSMAMEVIEPKQSNEEMLDMLQKQLNNLDADTKEVIMLRFYSQMQFREIAQIRSEPIGTTLAKLHRGVKKLRELME